MPTYRLGTPEIKAYWDARKAGKSPQEATDAAEKVKNPTPMASVPRVPEPAKTPAKKAAAK